MEDRGSKQVGARLPGHIYRWLKEKVENNDYPNMSQAVIGELTKAKHNEERGLQSKLESVREPSLSYGQEEHIRKQIGNILGELREEVLRGVKGRQRE